MNAKTTYRTLSIVLTLLALLLGGCKAQAANEIRLSGADDGGQVDLSPGQVLVVELDSNVTTGYSWSVAELPNGVLEQDGEAVYTQPERNLGLVGAGGVETLRFKAVKAGEGALKLAYRRPWEKDAPPAEEFTIQVVVK